MRNLWFVLHMVAVISGVTIGCLIVFAALFKWAEETNVKTVLSKDIPHIGQVSRKTGGCEADMSLYWFERVNPETHQRVCATVCCIPRMDFCMAPKGVDCNVD